MRACPFYRSRTGAANGTGSEPLKVSQQICCVHHRDIGRAHLNGLGARKTSLSGTCLHSPPMQSHYCGTKRALTLMKARFKSANGMPRNSHSLASDSSRVCHGRRLSRAAHFTASNRWRRASALDDDEATAGAVWSR